MAGKSTLSDYRIAGNFGGSKLWRMVLNLRFGEFNFGALSLSVNHSTYVKIILACHCLILAKLANSPKFTPAKITRYTSLEPQPKQRYSEDLLLFRQSRFDTIGAIIHTTTRHHG